MATKIFLADIDLNKNQLLNARLQNAASSVELNAYIPSKDNDPNPVVNLRRAINDPKANKDIGLLYWDTTESSARFLSGYTYPITAPGSIEVGSPIPIWKSLGGSGSGVLTSDFYVDLKGTQKWFGKYQGGTRVKIANAGTSIEAMLKDVAIESSAPTATLTLSSNSFPFNSASMTNTITFSGASTTFGATITSAALEYRRGSGVWEVLNEASPYVHTISLGAGSDRTSPFNYRLTVTDSNGQITITSTSAIIAGKSAPTMTGIPSTLLKEKGDLQAAFSVALNKNSSLVPLKSYHLYAKIDDGNSVYIGASPTSIALDPSTLNISIAMSNDQNIETINGAAVEGMKNASKITIHASVIDTYTNSSGAVVDTTTELLIFTRNYELKKFYGTRATAITSTSQYRDLNVASFTATNLSWNATGTKQIIALPVGKAFVSAITTSNIPLTVGTGDGSFVLSSAEIPDAGGTSRTYNIYTLSTAVSFDVVINAIVQ